MIDALEDVGITALEPGGLTALLQLALVAEVDQFRQFSLKALQYQGDVVDVLFHFLVIAVIGRGDQFIDLAAGHLIKDAVALADRQKDSVKQYVDVAEDFLEVAGGQSRIGAIGQTPLLDGVDQAADFIHGGPLRVHTLDCGFAHLDCLLFLRGFRMVVDPGHHFSGGGTLVGFSENVLARVFFVHGGAHCEGWAQGTRAFAGILQRWRTSPTRVW